MVAKESSHQDASNGYFICMFIWQGHVVKRGQIYLSLNYLVQHFLKRKLTI